MVWYGLSNSSLGLIVNGAAPKEVAVSCPNTIGGAIVSLGDTSQGQNSSEYAIDYACGAAGYGTYDTVQGDKAYSYAQNDPNGSDGFSTIGDGYYILAGDEPSYFGTDGGGLQFLDQNPQCGTGASPHDVCEAYFQGPWPNTVALGSMVEFDVNGAQEPAVTVSCPFVAVTEFQDDATSSRGGSAIDIFGFAQQSGSCTGDPVQDGLNPTPAPQFQRIPIASQSAPHDITVGGPTYTALYFVESDAPALGIWDAESGKLSEYPLPAYALGLACDVYYCYIPEPKADKIAIFNISTTQIIEISVPTANAYPQYATIEADPEQNGNVQEHIYFTELQGQKLGVITPPYVLTASARRRANLRRQNYHSARLGVSLLDNR